MILLFFSIILNYTLWIWSIDNITNILIDNKKFVNIFGYSFVLTNSINGIQLDNCCNTSKYNFCNAESGYLTITFSIWIIYYNNINYTNEVNNVYLTI